MLANRTSRWTIGAVLICIALLAASWFLLITPRRADASTVRDQVTASDAKAGQLQLQIEQLKAQFADLPKRKAQLTAIKAQLPPTANIPALVRDLESQAVGAGVSLDTLTPGSPTVLTPAGAAPTPPGPGTVVMVPISLTVSGDYFEASLFVKNLQTKIQRSFLISALDVAASQTSTAPTATPTSTSTTAVTATATSTATASPTPTSTASAAPTLNQVSLTITGSIFVLMDGTSTLAEVTKEAKAAAVGKQALTATPTSKPTSGPTAATTTR